MTPDQMPTTTARPKHRKDVPPFDLWEVVKNVSDPRNFPQRRATFVAATPINVIVWRVISRDPDENEDHAGVLIGESLDEITILEPGEAFPRFYPKRTAAGVTLYRMKVLHP